MPNELNNIRIDPVAQISDTELAGLWTKLIEKLESQFGHKLGVEGVLFYIGIQEGGQGFQPDLARKKKQNLIMDGTWAAMTTLGIYERAADGKKWRKTGTLIPDYDVDDQERLLKIAILTYFDQL